MEDPPDPVIETLRTQFDLEMPCHQRNANLTVYRDFVAQRDDLIDISEQEKSDVMAIILRQFGNEAYAEQDFVEALQLYNHSLGNAENGSEQLGFGYANRSAVFYQQGEYEFALYNIDLARKHNYPEAMMPKLQAREIKCKTQLAGGHSNGSTPNTAVDINVELNPLIPFLAKGIDMKSFRKMGRGLVAEREFTTGDVILDEKVAICSVSHSLFFLNCCHCGSEFRRNLIPCPGCAFYAYCSEECREQDLHQTHRFECSVATKLWCLADKTDMMMIMMMMSRLFFYGLSAFGDNINKMMEYCQANAFQSIWTTGSNPFELDFANLNPLEVFKVLHNTNPLVDPSFEHDLKLNAAAYHLIFMKNPLVQKIFRTEAQRNFMLRYMLIHGRIASSLTLKQNNGDDQFIGNLSPIATICNHSCDPNATTIIDSGKVKIIILRPIAKGDQILTTYGPAWWRPQNCPDLNFDCLCPVCDDGPEGEKWNADQDRAPMMPPNAPEELFSKEGNSTDLIYKLGKFQQMVKFLSREHLGQFFGVTVNEYHDTLIEVNRQKNMKLDRAKAQNGRSDDALVKKRIEDNLFYFFLLICQLFESSFEKDQ